jgi:hypothetical protein
MTRAELLALADCVACLELFANEGIAMTPDGPNSDPQDVLCRAMVAMGIADMDWGDIAAALRARAEELP